MSASCRLASVSYKGHEGESNLITNKFPYFPDLSGLTLQAGPRSIVKDEYTPGVSIVGDSHGMDGNEHGTIQHHPIHIQGIPGVSYAAMAIQPGSGECLMACVKCHECYDYFIICLLFTVALVNSKKCSDIAIYSISIRRSNFQFRLQFIIFDIFFSLFFL